LIKTLTFTFGKAVGSIPRIWTVSFSEAASAAPLIAVDALPAVEADMDCAWASTIAIMFKVDKIIKRYIIHLIIIFCPDTLFIAQQVLQHIKSFASSKR
jgi:hypothetical protein